MRAWDPDVGANGSVTYHLRPTDGRALVAVAADSGEVTLLKDPSTAGECQAQAPNVKVQQKFNHSRQQTITQTPTRADLQAITVRRHCRAPDFR